MPVAWICSAAAASRSRASPWPPISRADAGSRRGRADSPTRSPTRRGTPGSAPPPPRQPIERRGWAPPRGEAADRALEMARQLATGERPSEPEPVAAIVALRTAASDLMIFAGVDADQAEAAVREGTGEFEVPAPPPAPRAPFGLPRPT